jgi:hypothetical protein
MAMTPLDRLLYWIRERHQIFLRKEDGHHRPWTLDPVMRRGFFTCPYRENDKTTAWFRTNVRDPGRDGLRVIFATVTFRWFNHIATGEVLHQAGLLTDWNEAAALAFLRPIRDSGGQIFTGAFRIASPAGQQKLEAICRCISHVWRDRPKLQARAQRWRTLQEAHSDLMKYDGLGGFMAYEIVSDLRYTDFLEHATDKLTWCNPGPGAVKGLCRLHGEKLKQSADSTTLPRMRQLLPVIQERLSDMPPFEMRELEHSLCEYAKYCHGLFGDGRLKRRYPGEAAR